MNRQCVFINKFNEAKKFQNKGSEAKIKVEGLVKYRVRWIPDISASLIVLGFDPCSHFSPLINGLHSAKKEKQQADVSLERYTCIRWCVCDTENFKAKNSLWCPLKMSKIPSANLSLTTVLTTRKHHFYESLLYNFLHIEYAMVQDFMYICRLF